MAEPVASESRRVFANLGLLLGGKAGAGLMSLVYLFIVTRVLGAADYGVLVLVSGFVTLVAGIVAFSGWHGLARFGALALVEQDAERLLRLIRFMTLLELACGLVAIVVAALLAPVVGAHLGWPPQAIRFAVPYSLAVLATVRSTPEGLLQLAGRVDLISAHSLLSPVVRLVGSLIVWLSGGGLIGFLSVWLVSSIVEGAGMWLLGLVTLRRMALSASLRGSLAGTIPENPGLVRFIVTTNFDLTLRELAPRLGPLTVGWLLGPSAAGVMALAQRATAILQQPALLLGRASYAVMARLAASGNFAALQRTVWQSAATSLAAGVPVVALLCAFPTQVLQFIGGHSFTGGAGLMIFVALARLVDLPAPPFVAALTAIGRPSRSIMVNIVAGFCLYPLLPILIGRFGLIGAGWHALAQSIIGTAILAWLFVYTPPQPTVYARP
ncbi:MAG: lipopolysaccharide biosynthesis protein [Janthinobacterium lividum]